MGFQFLQTDDGSPSLKFGPDSEPMHNSKGAFSETLYVYGNAITKSLDLGLMPSFLSVGLGIGYCELVTIAILLSRGFDIQKVYGESFEAVDELIIHFLNWLASNPAPSEFESCYDRILDCCSKQFKLEPNQIKTALCKLADSGNWRFRESLDGQTKFEKKFSCILFDAFSSKTTPELWDEKFLIEFLKKCAGGSCVVSTYARTGALKRALTTNGFVLEIRTGFGGKRDSTLAVRLKEES